MRRSEDAVEFRRRGATAADDEFLLALYASTREDLNAASLAAKQKQLLVEMQHNAQRQQYAFAFPNAEHYVIEVAGEPIGRLLINRGANELRLIDIALLPAYRNRGIGAALIRQLLQEAETTSGAVRLQVQKANPAADLYRRLGFSFVHDDDAFLTMEWRRQADFNNAAET